MKHEQFGPNQQSMTGHIAYCGAEFSEFLGGNSECPHSHSCGCSPKHSSSPICHRCSCDACASAKAEWSSLLNWECPRQLELFDVALDV